MTNNLDPKQLAVALSTPATFAQVVDPNYKIPPHIALANRKIVEAATGRIKRLIVMMPPRHGKALDTQTPVRTTEGWKRHGELESGDRVFNPDGKPVKVMAVGEPLIEPCLVVRFNNGAQLKAHPQHEWRVLADRDCRRKGCGPRHIHRHEELLETQALTAGYLRRAHAIPVAKPLVCDQKTYTIDPYLLGIWLGDGNSRMGYLHCGEQDLEHYRTLGEPTEERATYWRILVRGMKRKLEDLNLLCNKHIPLHYLHGSYEDRLALLQGLMDSDGHSPKTKMGQSEFCNTNKRLAKDTLELIRSLGFKANWCEGRATIKGKDFGPKYRVMFTPHSDRPVHRLERKRVNQHPTGPLANNHYIKSVEPGPTTAMNCIQVEGGMYLAGRELIPTHNSELISRFTPPWYICMWPTKRVILASYEHHFATSWGRKSRTIVANWGPSLFDVHLRKDSKRVDEWYVQPGDAHPGVEYGGMITAGVGGPITGRGGDLIIIDDYFKNAAEALSKVKRESIWDWYVTTAHTRLEPGGSIICLATRWHHAGLIGRILETAEETGEHWEVIKFPALAEDNDPLGREKGEALWPERYDADALERIRAMEGRWFEALYQQNPTPEEGGVFKQAWFKYYVNISPHEVKPEDGASVNRNLLTRFITVDLATTTKTSSDYTVVQVWGADRDTRRLYLLDQVRERMEGPDIIPTITRLHNKHQTRCIWIESVAFQQIIVQQARREGLPVRELLPDRDKESRAYAATPYFEGGQVYFPRTAHYTTTLENELLSFPASNHDDQVDALAYAVAYAAPKSFKSPNPPLPSDPNQQFTDRPRLPTGIELRRPRGIWD